MPIGRSNRVGIAREDAAPKGAAYIRNCIRRVTDKTFDDVAERKGDPSGVRAILGLE